MIMAGRFGIAAWVGADISRVVAFYGLGTNHIGQVLPASLANEGLFGENALPFEDIERAACWTRR